MAPLGLPGTAPLDPADSLSCLHASSVVCRTVVLGSTFSRVFTEKFTTPADRLGLGVRQRLEESLSGQVLGRKTGKTTLVPQMDKFQVPWLFLED